MTTEIATRSAVMVTPLEDKLRAIGTSELPDDWYRRAVMVLRGGDGGEHGKLLYKLILALSESRSQIVAMDVGTARGFSALAMARAIDDAGVEGAVYSVDTVGHGEKIDWHGRKHDDDDALSGRVLSRMDIWERWFQDDISSIIPIRGRSVDVLGTWEHGWIDVAFLDGSHAYPDVSQELARLDGLVTDGGIVVLDDYHMGDVVGRIRSRLLNAVVWLIGRTLGRILRGIPSASLRLGEDIEYRLVKQRFGGVRRAVEDFVRGTAGRWSLEVVPMPQRGSYQGGDYSVAILSRHESVGELGSISSGE